MSQRPFDSVWDTDICLFDCLVHKVFNLTSPKTSPGELSINDTARVVNASVLTERTGVAYVGDSFGCQLQLVNQVGPVWAQEAPLPAPAVSTHIHCEVSPCRNLALSLPCALYCVAASVL